MRKSPGAGRSCGQSLCRAEKGLCTGRHVKPHSGPHSFFTPVHPLPINTHGPPSLLRMLLLTPYCLNCFRVKKKILTGTCYTPGRRQELSGRTPEQQNRVCSTTAVTAVSGKNWPSKPSKNCFLTISFSPLLWISGKSLTAAPKLWQFVVFIVSCCLCW